MKTSFLKKSVQNYPELLYMTFFCIIPAFPDISVPLKLSTSGSIVSLSSTEYENLKEWSIAEFFPHIPSHVDKSKITIQCLRDIFTQPDRSAKSFRQLVKDIECKPNKKTGAQYSTDIEENSTLSVHELVLYSLLRISGYQMSTLDANQISKYEQVFLDNEDKLDDFTDLFDFMQQCNKIIESRRKLFYDIIKSFCFYNSEQLICALNSEFFDKDIFDDAEKICENLKSGTTYCNLNVNMIFPLIGLKYCWPLVNDKFKHWNVQFESERAYFWTTEQNNPTVITKQIYVDEDLTWTAFVKEKPINLEWIETQPILNTV